jgi:hypothetical protein
VRRTGKALHAWQLAGTSTDKRLPRTETQRKLTPTNASPKEVLTDAFYPKVKQHQAVNLSETRVGKRRRMRGASSALKRQTTKRISTMSQPLSPRHAQSSDQAQVLYACITTVSSTFNSLSKVLCTFPSRYLFAIGLELVLSFRWNVPPNLRCRPRQHDSESTDRTQPLSDVRRDSHPLLHPLPRDLHLRSYWNRV